MNWEMDMESIDEVRGEVASKLPGGDPLNEEAKLAS